MNSEKLTDSLHENLESGQTLYENLQWLSTKDAAIYLRKFRVDGTPSEGAIRNLVWRGILKARKWRRRLFFKRTDLDRLIQNAPFTNGGLGWA